jgi:glycosyl hydrolase family 99
MRLLGRGLAAAAATAVLAAPSATATPRSALAAGSITLPTRAAFYYPWFPEIWTVKGAHVFYHPTLGYYDSSDVTVVDAHVAALDYARVAVSIASWWGVGIHQESVRIPLLLNRTAALGSPLKWALYHEQEGQRNPTVAELQADLAYASNYATHPTYAHVDGKPVIFVYNPTDTACEVADRWSQASAGAWYVVLLVLPGYRTCPTQPDSWHNYAPAHAEDSRPGYSFSISPGFWRADEPTPRLERDLDRFRQNIRNMIASQAPWQLITTFNEWGEGTAVEAATEWGQEYLTALHDDGQVPTAVTLHTLRAVRAQAGVLLRWRTAPGSRVLGFNVYRDQNGKRLKLNRTLIASVPGGRGHSWLDRRVPGKGAVRYWLEEISVNGARRRHGPILVS